MKLAYTVVTPELARMPMGWVGDPDVILPKLGKMGYEGVELQLRDPAEFDTDAYRKKVENAGMRICAVSTGGIGDAENMFLTSPDAETRKRAVARYKTVIDVAARYGVDASIGRFRGLMRWAPDRATGMSWFRGALEELLPYAERQGVRIVLEPQHAYNLDSLNTFAETLAFIATFKSNSLVSDSNRLPPGMGIFNWVDILETLRAVGYDGWISVECKQFPDSEHCAQHTYTFLNNVLSLPELG
jgi:sugar phosphate isomerase/epimerase